MPVAAGVHQQSSEERDSRLSPTTVVVDHPLQMDHFCGGGTVDYYFHWLPKHAQKNGFTRCVGNEQIMLITITLIIVYYVTIMDVLRLFFNYQYGIHDNSNPFFREVFLACFNPVKQAQCTLAQ
ncbi:hypothetical protein [Candidatus Magnetaquicoccus inordinatus]|uniref:hypothetical protein n=1 Tax=Candidatus Magnetaquicoccus inordinatus TaxID=2496818 RepID=UPI00102B3678|nr:hypothetical protein [Candidatus Magnetaquicoccus inordinatus]